MSKKIDDSGELKSIPNEKWAKFFDKFNEIETLDVSQWKVVHLLGYFIKKYKETYQIDYPWKFNNQNPNKSFEVWQMNTLAAKLSANPKILKDYIDWAYDNLVPKAKRRLTSISFMTKDEIVNPYKVDVLLGGKKNLSVDRTTPLPTIFSEVVFNRMGHKFATYGDLAFVDQIYNDTQNEKHDDWLAVRDELKDKGFDLEILSRVV